MTAVVQVGVEWPEVLVYNYKSYVQRVKGAPDREAAIRECTREIDRLPIPADLADEWKKKLAQLRLKREEPARLPRGVVAVVKAGAVEVAHRMGEAAAARVGRIAEVAGAAAAAAAPVVRRVAWELVEAAAPRTTRRFAGAAAAGHETMTQAAARARLGLPPS